MMPHLDEAALMLRLADRDIAALDVLCRAEEVSPCDPMFPRPTGDREMLQSCSLLPSHRVQAHA